MHRCPATDGVQQCAGAGDARRPTLRGRPAMPGRPALPASDIARRPTLAAPTLRGRPAMRGAYLAAFTLPAQLVLAGVLPSRDAKVDGQPSLDGAYFAGDENDFRRRLKKTAAMKTRR